MRTVTALCTIDHIHSVITKCDEGYRMMVINNPKPCKICGIVGHSASFCYWRKRDPIKRSKPATTNRRAIKRLGKHGKKWLAFRAQWFEDHPQDLYICYYCGDRLTRRNTTLDHKIPRSRRPDLRYDVTNIVTSCWRCNTEKGSKDDQQFINKS